VEFIPQIWKKLAVGSIVLFLSMTVCPVMESYPFEKNQSLVSQSSVENVTLSGIMGENGWYTSAVVVTITGGGWETGPIIYKIDDQAWEFYSAPIIICSDGYHTVWWYFIDPGGNQSPLYNVSFKIDKTPPMLAILMEDLGFFEVKIIANLTDATSGPQRAEFYFDDVQEFIDLEAPFEWIWIGSGNHTVTVIGYDIAGHSVIASKSTSCVFGLSSHSTTTPSVMVRPPNETERSQRMTGCLDGIVLNGTRGDGNWFVSPVTISFTNENGSWAHCFVRIDTNEWFEYTLPVVVDTEGGHSVYWYYIDPEGNQSSTFSLSFGIDMTPPTITLLIQRIDFFRYLVILEVEDNISGFVLLEIYVDDALVASITSAPYEFVIDRRFVRNEILEVVVYDCAGNRGNASHTFPYEQAQKRYSQYQQVLCVSHNLIDIMMYRLFI
jgi:hypothetical protein